MSKSKVIKRDGSVVDFNRDKIEIAIQKAYKEVYPEADISDYTTMIRVTTNKVLRELNSIFADKDIDIEIIQDIVENELMEVEKNVAKAYITYRYKRKLIRNKDIDLMIGVGEKLSASNVQNQNANVDEYSFGGRIGEAASYVNKKYALDYCMCEKSKNHHLNNEIYEHDLDAFAVGSHNCLSVPIDDLLANGFKLRQIDIRPAQSANTAFQLVAVLFQIQSLQQFGGVSATHLDWSMVPYVRKSFMKHYIANSLKDTNEFMNLDILSLVFDNYTDEAGVSRNKFDDWIDDNKQLFFEKTNLKEADFKLDNVDKLNKKYYQAALYDTVVEVTQAVEGLYHNLNSLQSRSGNQLPFSSINYGTCIEIEGRLVTNAILNCSIKGVGKLHKTSIFPCGIFQYMKGVNNEPGTPNYDLYRLALTSTARRLYPNYANVDWSGNAGYDINDPRTYFSTMGCRTANGWDINGFGQLKDGRGNICPVSIILPTLAMQAKEQKDYENEEQLISNFLSYLDYMIDEAKDMLIERFNWICSQSPKSASFMYDNNVMAGYVPEEGIRSALKHGTLAIGQLGLAECLQILIGCDHTTEKGLNLAKCIEQLFKDKCNEFRNGYDNQYLPDRHRITNTMIENIEKKLNRCLTDIEKQEISNYCIKRCKEVRF
jgi:ribonucleoside-triphosphate reductase